MVELDQYKQTLNQYRDPVAELGKTLELDRKQARIAELEKDMRADDFWSDPDQAQKVMKELKEVKDSVTAFRSMELLMDDLDTLIELGNEEEDASVIPEVEELMAEFLATYEEMKIQTLFSGEYDNNDAIVTLHAGAGGTESCDWAGMLYRMYSKWADSHGFSTEVLDYLDGDEAGIKSITFEVKGEHAFGYLRSERGVHRLVRISPFNAAGKRQTSFASCDVMPDIDEDVSVEIADEDIRIDTYRSSGAGGQHVNKTDSAIRITHIPTGLVVQCQNERSQHKNRDKAMQILKARLYLLKQQENREKMSDIRGEVTDNAWGNQIRSYVLQPYTMVKDHRTNEEIGNAQSVLDGNLDPFMNAYLSWEASKGTE